MRWITTITLLIGTLQLSSCDDNLIDTSSKSFDAGAWPSNVPAQFEIAPVDTINDVDLFLQLRNTKEYDYKNLWLITQLKYPQGKIETDTLEYEMANASGEFLGTGNDIVENKLVYKRGFRFRESGTYQLQLQQAMRENGSATPLKQLEGVLDVGYTIEKQTKDVNN